MKNLLFFAFLYSSISFSQDLPAISFDETRLEIIEPSQASVKYEIKFSCTNTSEDTEPFYVYAEIDKKTTTADNESDYVFSLDSILIEKGKSSGSFWIHINSDAKDEINEVVSIKLKNKDEKDKKYSIGAKPSFDLIIREVANYQYIRLTTGVDFDFNSDENNAPVAFYGNLNGFFPNQFNQKFGVMFNLFSNRFNSIDSLRNTTTVNTQNGLLPGDSVAFNTVKLRQTGKFWTRNYGINIGGLLKLVEENNSSLFLGLQIEGAITKNVGTYTYDTLGVIADTSSLSYFNGLVSGTLLASRSTVFVPSITLSLPYRYMSENIEARVFFGASFAVRENFLTQKKKLSITPNFDVNVIDKKFGVTIGGNLRYDYLSSTPVINIYIAKSFRFSQFAKF